MVGVGILLLDIRRNSICVQFGNQTQVDKKVIYFFRNLQLEICAEAAEVEFQQMVNVSDEGEIYRGVVQSGMTIGEANQSVFLSNVLQNFGILVGLFVEITHQLYESLEIWFHLFFHFVYQLAVPAESAAYEIEYINASFTVFCNLEIQGRLRRLE